jgi:hypothetical protein
MQCHSRHRDQQRDVSHSSWSSASESYGTGLRRSGSGPMLILSGTDVNLYDQALQVRGSLAYVIYRTEFPHIFRPEACAALNTVGPAYRLGCPKITDSCAAY